MWIANLEKQKTRRRSFFVFVKFFLSCRNATLVAKMSQKNNQISRPFYLTIS